jgi:hypothetical protein
MSEIIPSLAWACWDEVWFDRGMANMANVVRSELVACMGASINFGPPRMRLGDRRSKNASIC